MRTYKYVECQSFNSDFKTLIKNIEEKYGHELMTLSGIGDQLDINLMSKKFYGSKGTANDISVDANANSGSLSVISFDNEISKPPKLLNGFYRLWKTIKKKHGVDYADDIIESILTGGLYPNDMLGVGSSKYYCYNYNCMDVAEKGIPKSLDGKGKSYPPKYLFTFLQQLVQFALIAGNGSLGATGLSNILLTMAVYIDKIQKTGYDSGSRFTVDGYDSYCDVHFHLNEVNEKRIWEYIEHQLTSFIYTINQPFRTGNESLFTNISLYDPGFIKQHINDHKLIIDGELYEAKEDVVLKLQDLFIDIMNKEKERRILTFPVTTTCFETDEMGIKDKEFLRHIMKGNSSFGFLNLFGGESSQLSSCCRLRSENDNHYFNTLGSGGIKIGSLSVCTLNLPQISFQCNNDIDLFFKILEKRIWMSQEINIVRRGIIEKAVKNGNVPIVTEGFVDLSTMYSTLGINGFYECLEILGYDITIEDGKEFGIKLCKFMNKVNNEIANKYKIPVNIEQTPSENSAVKLAQKDHYLGYNNTYDLYSNQFIPLTSNSNFFQRILTQGEFDQYFTGGSILHINLDQYDENNLIKDIDLMCELADTSFKNGVVYFAYNIVNNYCDNDHNFIGRDITSCPECGSKNIFKSVRVVGFESFVNNWNETRRNEYKDRYFYGEIKENDIS